MEWVCTQLEVFGCEIANIPRPDITRQIDGDPASDYVVGGTPEQSIDLQRAVYTQLGRLTKMRELTLGIELYDGRWGQDNYRLYDCLAMRLESRLGLMKDLKDLEIVRLEDMEVYIGRDREQAWVKENWPKIKDIFYDEYETDTYGEFEEDWQD